MKLYVDNREKKIYSLLIAFNFSNQSEITTCDKNEIKKNQSDCLSIESKQLELGDLVLCDDSDNILLIFERKSINDLASSLQDGRYKEQSSRLNDFDIENHNVIYIIEGNIDKVYSKTRVNTETLKSCFVSLNLNKGFSTLKTINIDDSARWILAYCYKIGKDSLLKEKLLLRHIKSENNVDKVDNTNHLDHLSKQSKSKYINKNNIQLMMLTLIPNVSVNIAKVIMERYKTIPNLISALTMQRDCLNDIKITNKEKERKIGKNVVNNIVSFLIEEQNIS